MRNRRSLYAVIVLPMVVSLLLACSESAQETNISATVPFSAAELFSRKVRDTYSGDSLRYIAFPLGGIGSGCISMSGTGKLIDWEIQNRPDKGFQPRYSFFGLWAREEGGEPAFKVLEGQLVERLDGPMYLTEDMWYGGNGLGPQQTQAAGLPRFRHCRFSSRFPFAQVDLQDEHMPVSATVEAWSPFIPGDSRHSSLPVAVFNITLTNTSSKPVDISLGVNVQNLAGRYNRVLREKSLTVLELSDGRDGGRSMFVASPAMATTWQTNWIGDNIWTALEHYARTFIRTGRFAMAATAVREEGEEYAGPPAKSGSGRRSSINNDRVGSLGFQYVLAPDAAITIPVVLGWYFPVFDTADPKELARGYREWRNYYGQQWASGLEVARYTVTHLQALQERTRLFQKRFFASTLPGVVLESIASQLAVLRSPTLIRYPDGTLYGWEGCAMAKRLGPGTANHVYNFQHVLPYLFPDLQRSMLENFYKNGFRESDGAIQYRLPLGPNARAQDQPAQEVYGKKTNFFTAADGQMGLVCQVYREWQLTGDERWLASWWPRIKKSLEYAWVEWDQDRDGLLEGSHHNTLDLNYSTPEPACGSLYQAALLAGEKMADHLGDVAAAQAFRRVYESGKRLTDQLLFNGEYYQQQTPAPGDHQLAGGCISEQVHGQLYARMLGLEDVFDRSHIHRALASLFRHNFKHDFFDMVNTYRAYSLGQDRGLVIATWPHGDRPEKPLLYADETMSGFEYQVAANLLYAGYAAEGLALIKAVRDRHDGKRRNPFCEFEWGNHYVRSMANYASLLAWSGFRYSAVEQTVCIEPAFSQEECVVFFSVPGGWGTLSRQYVDGRWQIRIDVAEGTLIIKNFILPASAAPGRGVALVNGERQAATVSVAGQATVVSFSRPWAISASAPLQVVLE